MQRHDTAPLIFQSVDDQGSYEIRVLVELDGKLAAFSREYLTEAQRDAVLDGELRVARMLWNPEAGPVNDQVHWCASKWRRLGFAPLVRNDLAFDSRQRLLIPRIEVGHNRMTGLEEPA